MIKYEPFYNVSPNPISDYIEQYVKSCQDEYDEEVLIPEKVIFNEKKKTTVLLWEDGDKTIVKTCKEDKFDKKVGFLTAYFQKQCGLTKNKANKYIDELIKEEIEILEIE